MPQSNLSKYPYDAFVSYCESDKDWVRTELLARLKRADIVYIDHTRFKLGARKLEQIERAIKGSRCVLLVFTRAYLADPLSKVIDDLSRYRSVEDPDSAVIPAMREECDLPLTLRTLVKFELRQPDDEAWERLVNNLKPYNTSARPDGQESGPVYDALNAVIQLMKKTAMSNVLTDFANDFNTLRQQIAFIKYLKNLHEAFQIIEDSFNLVYAWVKSLASDSNNNSGQREHWRNLSQSLPGFVEKLGAFLALWDTQKQDGASDILSRERLSKSNTDMTVAADAREIAQLDSAALTIYRILSSQQSRINTILVAKAGELKLSVLHRGLSRVRDLLVQQERYVAKMRLIATLETGIKSVLDLEKDLKSQVAQHDALQVMDEELRIHEPSALDDISKLRRAWQDLKSIQERCVSSEPWWQHLSELGRKLEIEVTAGNVDKAFSAFYNYQAAAKQAFSAVDYNLLISCGDLEKLGHPVTALLEVL